MALWPLTYSTDAIPVHYVFPRQSLDVRAAAEALREASAEEFSGEEGKKGVVVVWDVAHDWLADEIQAVFTEALDVPVSFATIQRPRFASKGAAAKTEAAPVKTAGCCGGEGAAAEATSCCKSAPTSAGAACSSGDNDKAASSCCTQPSSCGDSAAPSGCCSTKPPTPSASKGKAPALRQLDPPSGLAMSDCVLYYLGPEGRSLLNLQMNHATNPIYAYAADRGAWAVHPASSRLLSRRLFALHSAMAADVFGLVVGNVGLSASKALVAELREALRLAKKKSYTLSVGRLNPAKLANFAEIECFVLIGCAEGGVVDSKVSKDNDRQGSWKLTDRTSCVPLSRPTS